MDQPDIPYESIDDYLLGRMDSDAASAFEQEIANDPALKQEVGFQGSIVNGVQVARKQQLKARLSEIPVSASPWAGAVQSTWLKVTTGIVVAGSISIAVYYQLDNDQSSDDIIADYIAISAPDEAVDPGIVELPVKDVVEETQNPEIDKPAATISEKENMGDEKVEELSVVDIPDVSIPEPVEPDVHVVYEEKSEVSFETLSPEATTSPVTVDVVHSLESRSYMYFDGVLGLRGDFEDITYDILEINDNDGRKLYLLIDGSYYALTSTETYKPLIKIVDKKLSKQLDVLRDYK